MTFEFPADTEEAVAVVRARYRALAAELHRAATQVDRDIQVIDGRWGGSAAPACQREVAATARLTAEAAEVMHLADAALLPYQEAVAAARAEIAAVQRSYAEGKASYDREKLDLDECHDSRLRRARAENVDHYWQLAYAQLGDRYGAIMETVATAAARARARLEELGSRIDGRQVVDSSMFGARLAAIHSLPMLQDRVLTQQVPRVLDLLRRAADGDANAVASLRRFRAASQDPEFAAALAHQLKVTGLLAIPARMSSAMRFVNPDSDAYGSQVRHNATTLRFVSSLLATATRRDTAASRELVSELTTAGRRTFQIGSESYTGYWAMSQILCTAPTARFSEHFARQIGSDMVRWVRNHDSISAPYGGVAATPAQRDTGQAMTSIDPRVGALELLRSRPDAAATVLLESPDGRRSNLKYLIDDCRDTWEDKGALLGDVIGRAGSGDSPQSIAVITHALRSTANATMDRIEVSDNDEGRFSYQDGIDDLSGLRGQLAGLMVKHFRDLGLVASSTRWASSPDRISSLSPEELTLALADVCRDNSAYGALVAASVKDVGDRLRSVPHHISRENQRTALAAAANQTGPLFGQIEYVREAGQLGDAAAADANNKNLISHVQDGLRALQAFAKHPYVQGGAASASVVVNQIPLPSNFQDAVRSTANEGTELERLVGTTVEDEIAHRGVKILDKPAAGDTSWSNPATGSIESPASMTDADYVDFHSRSAKLGNAVTNNVMSAVDRGRLSAQTSINSAD